jgi:hypothetical protein
LAMDADGDFVVTWESYDSELSGIFARRYNAAGLAQGIEFQVNTRVSTSQLSPVVAMDADGDFVVAWMSYDPDSIQSPGIYAQRYDSAGVPQGGEFRVNTTIAGTQASPSVAMDVDGDFVVSWQSETQDGSSYGVYAQRFNSLGVMLGGEFRVNTTTADSQRNPKVAMAAEGDFVIAWMSNLQDGSGFGAYAQRYDAAGVMQGAEFRVNTTTVDQQLETSVATDSDGDL